MNDANKRTMVEVIRSELRYRFRKISLLALRKESPLEAAKLWANLAEDCVDSVGEIQIIALECRTRFKANMADHEASKTPAPVRLFEQPKSP